MVSIWTETKNQDISIRQPFILFKKNITDWIKDVSNSTRYRSSTYNANHRRSTDFHQYPQVLPPKPLVDIKPWILKRPTWEFFALITIWAMHDMSKKEIPKK